MSGIEMMDGTESVKAYVKVAEKEGAVAGFRVVVHEVAGNWVVFGVRLRVERSDGGDPRVAWETSVPLELRSERHASRVLPVAAMLREPGSERGGFVAEVLLETSLVHVLGLLVEAGLPGGLLDGERLRSAIEERVLVEAEALPEVAAAVEGEVAKAGEVAVKLLLQAIAPMLPPSVAEALPAPPGTVVH